MNSRPKKTAPRELREMAVQDCRPMMHELYLRAEAQVRKQRKSRAGRLKPDADPQRLLHELQVHQVELEMQNTELQEARDRMEAFLEKYTDLYDFAPVGYFTLTPDAIIHLVNLTGARLAGTGRSGLVGRCFTLLVAAHERARFRHFLKEVLAGPDKRSQDFTFVSTLHPDRLVNIESQRMANAKECNLVVVDITGRKRTEEAVRVSEVRYRRLFEAAHDGVLLLDARTRKITDANPYMTRLLGYAHNQLVGKELFEIGLLKDEHASQEMFRKLKLKHEVRYEDLPLESQNGRHQEVEVVANLYEENGQPVIQCNIRDITARKLAEELLRRNEALFSTLIAQAPVGMYVLDSALRLQQVNPRGMPVFKKIHPLLGRPIAEIIRILWPPQVADKIISRFKKTLETGIPYEELGFTSRRKDLGVREHYEWQIQRVTLPPGEHGVVCFFSNVTERKEAEAARRRLDAVTSTNRKLTREVLRRRIVERNLMDSEKHQSLLLESSRAMQTQLRQLSRQVLQAQEDERKKISRELHDVIAQTLTGINIRLATLKEEASLSPTGLARNIDSTQKLVEHSVEIVHRFARELRPAVLDDLGLVPALHTFLKSFMEQTGIRTHLTAFAGVDQLDAARRTTLFRVIQEALTNVARHARATRADITIQNTAAGIVMKIKDDGKSFNVSDTLRLKGRKRLGLLGMRERLEMNGGRFEIMSAPGEGTTITAHLPPPAFPAAKAGRINKHPISTL